MNLFSNLDHGWCDLNIEDFHGRPSYIKYVPMNIIDAWDEYQNTGHCIIEFDEEGSEFCIVVWNGYLDNAVILSHKNGRTKSYFVKTSGKELLKQLVADIVSNVDEWAKWCSLGEDYSDIKTELEYRIHALGLN